MLLLCVLVVLGVSVYVVIGRREPKTVHEAAGRGRLKTVKLLLKADPLLLNLVDKQGDTPLNKAILGRQLEMCKFLIGRGCRIDPDTPQEWPAIVCAASRYGEVSDQIMQLLIDAGADVNAIYEPERVSAIHAAANNAMEAKVRMLVGAGADPNVLDKLGETALDRAVGTLSFLTGPPPDEVGPKWPDTEEHRGEIARLKRIIEYLKAHGALRAKELPQSREKSRGEHGKTPANSQN